MPAEYTDKIKGLSKEELEKKLEELKKELYELGVVRAFNPTPAKLSKIRIVRRSISRTLHVLRRKEVEKVHAEYKGKKYVPLDIRKKYTRAIRKRLTKEDQKIKTRKQIRKERRYPKRVFAVVA